MPQSMSFVRIGPAPEDETGLAPWPWNPNDVLLAEGMKPVGAKSYEGRGLTLGTWACNKGAVEIQGHPVDEACFVTPRQRHSDGQRRPLGNVQGRRRLSATARLQRNLVAVGRFRKTVRRHCARLIQARRAPASVRRRPCDPGLDTQRLSRANFGANKLSPTSCAGVAAGHRPERATRNPRPHSEGKPTCRADRDYRH